MIYIQFTDIYDFRFYHISLYISIPFSTIYHFDNEYDNDIIWKEVYIMKHCMACGGNSVNDVCEDCDRSSSKIDEYISKIDTMEDNLNKLKKTVSYDANKDMEVKLYIVESDFFVVTKLENIYDDLITNAKDNAYDNDDFVHYAIHDGYFSYKNEHVIYLLEEFLTIFCEPSDLMTGQEFKEEFDLNPHIEWDWERTFTNFKKELYERMVEKGATL
jgi:hypothetical protein